jgi:phage gp36-like protein
MALAAEVIARYPNSRLVQLTNPGDGSATTVDTTRLGYAVTDAQNEFEDIAGVAYDNSVSKHVTAAVQGVIAFLYLGAESPGAAADKEYDRFIEMSERVAEVTGRNRVKPTTSSILTPSSEQQGTETVRPDTDRENFDDLIPDPPA